MSSQGWSFVLQWARLGVNAVVFLIAARFLSLAEIGAFAAAFAPVRLAQSIHKAGIVETTIISGSQPGQKNALFLLSLSSGVLAAISLIAASLWTPPSISALLLMLSSVPLIHGLSAVSEGILRRSLAIRSLALRTVFAQGFAACATCFALWAGGGAAALVVFALSNALISGILSILLAKWWPTLHRTTRADFAHILKQTLQIIGRDISNAALFPLMQIGITVAFGLPTAGAFQIATRMLALVDALTLSPLRYIALPKFAALRPGFEFSEQFRLSLTRATLLGAWAWFGMTTTTPEILSLSVGAQHTPSVTPILHMLIPLGLVSVLVMPFNQALTSLEHTGLVLARAVFGLGLSLGIGFLSLGTTVNAVAMSLSFSSVLAMIWYLNRAIPRLGFNVLIFKTVLPALIAGAAMAVCLILMEPLWHAWSIPARMLAKLAAGTLIYGVLVSVFYGRITQKALT